MGAANLGDLRSVRKALCKSQSELATLLGISTRAIQSYEQGWRSTPPYVQKLAGLLLFLQWQKDNGRSRPCWGIIGCDPEARSQCFAYQYRAGNFCWLVTGNWYKGREQESWQAKLAKCRKCPVMKRWL